MIIRTGSFTFPRRRGMELRTEQRSCNFTQLIRQAKAIFTGTPFGFALRTDHHLGKVVVRLSTSIDDAENCFRFVGGYLGFLLGSWGVEPNCVS